MLIGANSQVTAFLMHDIGSSLEALLRLACFLWWRLNRVLGSEFTH